MVRTISDVKIEYTDPNTDEFSPRTLRVQTRHGSSFMTPTKTISHKELFSKSNTPELRGVLPGDLAVFPLYVKGDVFSKYCKCNGELNKIYENMIPYSKSTSFIYNVPSFQMEKIDPKDPASMSTLLKQINIPTLSAVCMPVLNTDLEGFKRNLKGWSECAEEHDKDCVPQISMDESLPIFEQKLELVKNLSKTGEIKMVDFVYKDLGQNTHQYSTLWSQRMEINAILHCSSVPRNLGEICNYMKSIGRYDLTMLGFDSISIERGQPRFMPSPRKPIGLKDIKYYKWSNVGIEANINGNYWESMDHDHAFCNCPICRGKVQKEILEKYAYNIEKDIMDDRFMDRVSILHDHYSSSVEMNSIRDAIRNGETSDYKSHVIDDRKRFQGTVKFGEIRKYPKQSAEEDNTI